MSIERIKGEIAYHCDLSGCQTSLETGQKDFAAAREVAQEEGWQTRKRGEEWKNFCCPIHEEMDFRGQKI